MESKTNRRHTSTRFCSIKSLESSHTRTSEPVTIQSGVEERIGGARDLGTSRSGNMLGYEPSTRWPTLLGDKSLVELYVSTLSSAAGRASRYVG